MSINFSRDPVQSKQDMLRTEPQKFQFHLEGEGYNKNNGKNLVPEHLVKVS